MPNPTTRPSLLNRPLPSPGPTTPSPTPAPSWITAVDVAAQIVTPSREAVIALDAAAAERKKAYLRDYYQKNKATIIAANSERQRQREQQAQERRDAHYLALRAIHPFNLTPDEAIAFDQMAEEDREQIFNLREDTFTVQDIIETRVDEDLLALEANQPKPSYRDMVKKVFKQAFAREAMTLEDTEPQRIAVVWRIVREMARIRGVISNDQTLAQALEADNTNPDPWTVPETHRHTLMNVSPSPPRQAITTIERAELLAEEWQWCRFNEETGDFETRQGLAYMPPPIPLKWLNIGQRGIVTDPKYEPSEDKLLLEFIKLLRQIAVALYINDGSPAEPDYGTMGMTGLLRPDTVRLAFPSKSQILTFESLMIQKTGNWLVFNSVTECRKSLKQEFGLLSHEINALIRCAKSNLKQQMEGDVEEERSLMLLRLEDYLKRSKSALDLNSEMKGLKQMSIILGLAKIESDDEMSDFLDVVRQFNKDKREQLPQHQAIEARPSSVKVLRAGD